MLPVASVGGAANGGCGRGKAGAATAREADYELAGGGFCWVGRVASARGGAAFSRKESGRCLGSCVS